MKHPASVTRLSSHSGNAPSATRFLLENQVERGLWIASNDQSVGWPSSFPSFALRLGLFRHIAVQSYPRFSEGMPHPGIEPGRPLSPVRPRGCKPRAYASSASGAQRALDVGAEGGQPQSAPTRFEPVQHGSTVFSLSLLFLKGTFSDVLGHYLLHALRRLINAPFGGQQ